MNSELNGLRNIVGTGTFGGIEAPPVREDFDTDEMYEWALRGYDRRCSPFWKASVQPPLDDRP